MNALPQQLIADSLLHATFSQPRKGCAAADKVTVKSYAARDGVLYQFAFYTGAKVKHENLPPTQAAERMAHLLDKQFHQALFTTPTEEIHAVHFAKLKLKRTPKATQAAIERHNRVRQTILREGDPIPFLIELGVMNEQGQVFRDKSAKLRQINHFLELLSDGLAKLPTDRPAHIVDFGCGKSYLTFALHHHLTHNLHREVHMVGLDLKADVIEHCNDIATKLTCNGLTFQQGDIQGLHTDTPVDMIISLHACDTATDDALLKAIGWHVPLIYCAPCCQHEFFQSIARNDMDFIFKHGILKERTAALVTDALRAQVLEACGYKTTIGEFIDLEHTPKNLLLKAHLTHKPNPKKVRQATEIAAAWSLQPYLLKQLAKIIDF